MRLRRDDVIDYAIREILLFRISAHVDEWAAMEGLWAG
jgi:hypothetical protein